MGIFRVEWNVSTRERLEIEQVIYKNSDGDIIVLDEGEAQPEGFEVFQGE
ncbi:hypothetical protein AH02_16 [Pseudomonas phage AH02]|nr:hypothetical protein AH02_16 [Pseudomonas phage AH02]